MLFVLMNTGDKYPFTQNIVQTLLFQNFTKLKQGLPAHF